MRKYYKLSDDTITVEAFEEFKGIVDRHLVVFSNTSMLQNTVMIIKGIDSPISHNGRIKEVDMLMDAAFDKNINNELQAIFGSVDSAVSIDGTCERFTNVFNSDLDDTDIKLLNAIKSDLEEVGIKMNELLLKKIGGC